MIENVTIVDKNGNGILAEGIMYANIKTMVDSATSENGKDYIFYCLNEMVDSEQTKIYISEASTEPGNTNPIGDLEWRKITDLLLAISHKETITNVEYKKMTGMTFHVSDPKKLAIKLPVKQALKDAYFSGVLTAQENTATQGAPVFVDNDLAKNGNTPNGMVSDVNAFTTMPTMVPNTLSDIDINQQNGAISTSPSTPIVVQTGAAQVKMGNSISTIPNEQKNPVQNLNNGTAPLSNPVESVLQEEPPLLPPNIENVESTSTAQIEEVTVGDVEKALKVLNAYFKNLSITKTPEIKDSTEIDASAIGEKEEAAIDFPDYTLPDVVPVPNTLEVVPIAAVNPEVIPSSEAEVNPTILNEGNSGTTTIQVIPSEHKNEEKPLQEQGEVGFIDTSASGLSASTQQTLTTGNDLTTVNFNIPETQPKEAVTVETLKPISPAPSLFEPSIPLVDPVASPPHGNESYVHVASGNQGVAPINTGVAQVQNMPPVQMPYNAVGVKEATSKMLEQGNLGPSGLS